MSGDPLRFLDRVVSPALIRSREDVRYWTVLSYFALQIGTTLLTLIVLWRYGRSCRIPFREGDSALCFCRIERAPVLLDP